MVLRDFFFWRITTLHVYHKAHAVADGDENKNDDNDDDDEDENMKIH